NQIQKLQAAVGVLLGNGYHQPQVGLDQLALGLFRLMVTHHDGGPGGLQLRCRRAGFMLQPLNLLPQLALFPLQLLDGVRAPGRGQLVLQLGVAHLQRADLIHDAEQPLRHPLPRHRREAHAANQPRQIHLRPRKLVMPAPMLRPLARQVRVLLVKLLRTAEQRRHLLHLPQHLRRALLQHFLGDLILFHIHRDELLHPARSLAQFPPSASSSLITIGERDSAFSTRNCPRSIRLAISTSPSRVSNGTVPISRRYMRTGSLVFSSAPGVRSRSASSSSSVGRSAPSSCTSSIASTPGRRPKRDIRSSRSSLDCTSPFSSPLSSSKRKARFLPVCTSLLISSNLSSMAKIAPHSGVTPPRLRLSRKPIFYLDVRLNGQQTWLPRT